MGRRPETRRRPVLVDHQLLDRPGVAAVGGGPMRKEQAPLAEQSPLVGRVSRCPTSATTGASLGSQRVGSLGRELDPERTADAAEGLSGH